MPFLSLLTGVLLLASLQLAPNVVYGTYIGGRDKDVTSSLAIDSSGNVWVAGNTPSPDFPVTRGALKTRASVNNDDSVGFVTKVSSAGDHFVYSTYLGGSWRSSANAIAVDKFGHAVVVGSTCSPDFPVTENGLQRRGLGGGHGLEPCDGYVVKLDAAGSHAVYATYFGGSDADTVNAVAVNQEGQAVVAGWTRSPNFFGTSPRGESDAFIALLGVSGDLVWIRRIGGSAADWFSSVAIARDGTIWAAGISESDDLPCRGRVPERPYGFLLRMQPRRDPECVRFSGQPAAISLDTMGRAYVGGSVVFGARTTGFAVRFTGLHMDWYRRVGGTDETRILGISAGLPGSVLVCGSSYSRDFPVTRGTLARYPGKGSDMILLRMSAVDGAVLYGTFLGGKAAPDIAPVNNTAVAVQADAQGNVWIAGNAIGHPGWISPTAAQSQHHENTDAFVLRLRIPLGGK